MCTCVRDNTWDYDLKYLLNITCIMTVSGHHHLSINITPKYWCMVWFEGICHQSLFLAKLRLKLSILYYWFTSPWSWLVAVAVHEIRADKSRVKVMFEIFIVAASPSRQLKFRRRQWALIKQSVASYRKWRSCFATLMENLMITNSQEGRGASLTRKNGRREYWLYLEVLQHGEWCLVVRSIIAQ